MKWTAEDAAKLQDLQRRQKQFYDEYLPAVNEAVSRHCIVSANTAFIAKKLADHATEIRAVLKPFDGSLDSASLGAALRPRRAGW